MEILSATTVFDSHVGQTKMKKVTIDQIITDENATIFDPTSSDHITYPEFVAYFAGISHITRHHLIIGANFTYGWMPTMFEFKTHDLEDAVLILNMAKKRQLITIAEMKALSNVLNNSMVGTSKLLHFIAPDTYAIWDSRVYRYINRRDSYDDMIKPENYFDYLANCRNLIKDPAFFEVHRSVNMKLGYVVSPLRAIELVMYMNGGK